MELKVLNYRKNRINGTNFFKIMVKIYTFYLQTRIKFAIIIV